MTTTYTNNKTSETAEVIMDGMACGLHRNGETCVRQTADGSFAVISTKTTRLLKTFANRLDARRYNFAIHGDNLSE